MEVESLALTSTHYKKKKPQNPKNKQTKPPDFSDQNPVLSIIQNSKTEIYELLAIFEVT